MPRVRFLLTASILLAGLGGAMSTPAGAATSHGFSISPTAGPPRTIITARGASCHYQGASDSTVQVKVYRTPNPTGAALAFGSVRPTANGTWVVQLSRLRAVKRGTYYVLAQCSSVRAGMHFDYRTDQFHLT